MDGGPYRTPRPTQGRVMGRPEVTQQKPEELQPLGVEPKPAHRAVASHQRTAAKASGPPKRFMLPIIIGVIVVVLGIAGWLIWSKIQSSKSAIDTSKYQAIFFTNGQVYFGKLQSFNNEHMKLKDVYYLQTQAGAEANTEELQKTATDQNNVQLIKLGDEIHGPQDEMIISKSQMLFYENLKSDGKVAQSIEQYKKSK